MPRSIVVAVGLLAAKAETGAAAAGGDEACRPKFVAAARARSGGQPRHATVAATAKRQVAGLCERTSELVRIEQKNSDNLQPASADETFEESDTDGSKVPLILDRKVDLNGDGNPEVVFANPALQVWDALYLSWFVNCGNGLFYPLFSEYAADYEVDGAAGSGWKLIQLFNDIAPNRPHYIATSSSIYRFDGSHYVLLKSRKVNRRIF